MIARYYNVDGSKIACNLLGGTDMIHPETFKFLDSSTLYRRVETKEVGMEKCRQCAFQHERMLRSESILGSLAWSRNEAMPPQPLTMGRRGTMARSG